jgi:hypothetical protein
MWKVFISYSHKDREWKNRIVKHLGVLEKERKLEVWDDHRIAAGIDWLPEIERAIQTCDVALLLISADFLNSRFILGQEVTKLLKRRLKEGVHVIPIILWACAWTQVDWLAGIQARPVDGTPLSSLSKPKAESALAALAKEVLHLTTAIPRSALPTDYVIRHSQSDFIDPGLKEQAICLKSEAEFRIAFREWYQSPVSKDQIAKIKELIEQKSGSKSALVKSVDIRVKYSLLPLIRTMIEIESRLRIAHLVPFTQNRTNHIKENIQELVKERWPHIVYAAYRDAVEHFVHHVGELYDYKEAELSETRDEVMKWEFEGLFSEVDQLLQKALADSILAIH